MKKMILVLAIVLTISVPAAAFAATTTKAAPEAPFAFGGAGCYAANLTDEQKQQLEESFEAMLDYRRDAIKEMVELGTLTEEQGELALERLERMEAFHEEYGYGMMGGRSIRSSENDSPAAGGFGNGPGFGPGFGPGCMMQSL